LGVLQIESAVQDLGVESVTERRNLIHTVAAACGLAFTRTKPISPFMLTVKSFFVTVNIEKARTFNK
jgi:hypothetical protein